MRHAQTHRKPLLVQVPDELGRYGNLGQRAALWQMPEARVRPNELLDRRGDRASKETWADLRLDPSGASGRSRDFAFSGGLSKWDARKNHGNRPTARREKWRAV